MILTEEEAKEKECCRDNSTFCHASKCMAWWWAVEYPFNDKENKKGYCGLAGEP